jgi:hypothetical protein
VTGLLQLKEEPQGTATMKVYTINHGNWSALTGNYFVKMLANIIADPTTNLTTLDQLA